MNGLYIMNYSGIAGNGFGFLTLEDGRIRGADAAGIVYEGQYENIENTGVITGEVLMKIPANTPLITGAPEDFYSREDLIRLSLPMDFEDEQSIGVQTPTGVVEVSFKKIRDL